MPRGKDIKSNFYLENKKEYDCTITIHMEGKDPELLDHLMKSICFDTKQITYEGMAPIENHHSLTRQVFVKTTFDKGIPKDPATPG